VNRVTVAVAVLLLVATLLHVDAEGAPKPSRSAGKVTDAALKGVRIRAIAHLRGTQHADGSWRIEPTPRGLPVLDDMLDDLVSDVPGGIGGVTAMAVYALASAGVSAKDPALVRAVAWMRATPQAFRAGWVLPVVFGGRPGGGGTVAIAMRVLALTRVDPARFGALIREDAATIEAGVLADGTWMDNVYDPKARRKWNKLLRKSGSMRVRGSVRMTCLAAQALWAAQQHSKYDVAKRTWTRLRRRLAKVQRKNGTWAEDVPGRHRVGGTATAAALASYVTAQGRTVEELSKARADKVSQRGTAAWRKASGPVQGGSFVEYAFFSEVAATAADWKDADWYARIAADLVRSQRKDGSWVWGYETRDRREVRATAAALLCISGASKQLFKAKTD